MLFQALCIISYPLVISNLSYSPETPNLGQIWRFLEPCDLVIRRMTLKNNRAPLLCYFKLCAAFHSHWWIQTRVTELQSHLTLKRMTLKNNRAPLLRVKSYVNSNWRFWVKIGNFLPCVTLKFDGWPCKTIEHLFYATSSFVYHFIPIGEFKFELQSGNAQWVKFNDF